jgi:hypothetical protein
MIQSRAWLNAAGVLDAMRWLTAGDAGVWTWVADPSTSLGSHYFHNPRSLLIGAHEEPVLAAAGLTGSDALARARETNWGSAVVTVSPYGYRGGPVAVRDDHALGALADQLLADADERGATHVLSHYLLEDRDGPWIAALTERGGIPLVLGADAVLEIRWRSLSDYHGWLGSSRRSLRGRAERGERDIEWAARSRPGLSPRERSVPMLLQRHAARFDAVGHPPACLLRAAAAGDGVPRVLMTAAKPGAPARSALVVIDDGDVLYPKFFGTSVPRADYFPLVFSQLIASAIESGRQRIEYGGGSHRAKLFRGARLRPLLGVLVVLDPELRDRILPLVPRLSVAKLAYFSRLSERWHVDHAPIQSAVAATA